MSRTYILKRCVFQTLIKFDQRPIIQINHKIQTNMFCNLRYYTNNTSYSQLTEGEQYLYNKLQSKFQPIKLHVEDISGELIN